MKLISNELDITFNVLAYVGFTFIYSSETAVEVRVWVRNYIILFGEEVIIQPGHKCGDCFVNL